MNALELFPSSKNYTDFKDGDETEFEELEVVIRSVNNGYLLQFDGGSYVFTSYKSLTTKLKQILGD